MAPPNEETTRRKLRKLKLANSFANAAAIFAGEIRANIVVENEVGSPLRDGDRERRALNR